MANSNKELVSITAHAAFWHVNARGENMQKGATCEIPAAAMPGGKVTGVAIENYVRARLALRKYHPISGLTIKTEEVWQEV